MVTRWWLASASFPVVAGLLCALAIMFNVCAVSQGWREMIEANGSVSIIAQPAWAVALEVISLAFAVVAYIVFLLTMISERDPVKGFITTILCWCASGATLFSVIGVITGQHTTLNPQQSLRYTQNYFYGIFAAGLYILIAMLLAIYTASVHSVHLTREERRTVECTSIILRATTFCVFLLVGAAVYATIEGWAFMDALYWADTTLLTIGIGNMAPKTHLGQSLLFPYASAGILNTGLVISSLTSFTENIRQLSIRVKIEEVHSSMQGRRTIDESSSNGRSDREKQALHFGAGAQYPNKADLMKLQRIKRDFYRRHRWMTLLLSVAAWFFLWLVSAAVFRHSESQKWTYFQALYFTFTCLTTIGYGDLYPTSNFGKAYFVFWSLLALPVLTNLILAMGEFGFETLTHLLRYLGRLKASKLGRVNPGTHCEGERNEAATGPGLANDSNSHASEQKNSMQPSNGAPGSSSTYRTKEHNDPLVQAAHHSLILSEEIRKLISTLQNPSTTQLDVYSEWDRILPLLHPEGDGSDLMETRSLVTLYSHTGTVVEFLDSDRPARDMNREILWMLKFLTERVCSRLQDGLHREQRGRSDTLPKSGI